jgi:hypothetical protein
MKKIALWASVAVIAFASCKKYDTVSVVRTLPTVEIKGEKFITINVGGTVPDEGAAVVNDVPKEGENNLTAVENNVDPNTPGLYYMLYETETANGFTASAARYIAVTDYPDSVDISGNYLRAATGVTVRVDRVARALYRVADMGGAGIPNDVIYFVRLTDSTIALSPQYSESLHTEIYGVNGMFDYGPPAVFSYALRSPGYGTAQRTFVRQ